MVSSANFAPLSGNYIADILISEGIEAVFRKNSKIKFKKNDIIYQSAYSIGKLYFPIDMIVSFVCDLSSGYSAEFMQIGCDGVVGISAIMGGGGYDQHRDRPNQRYSLSRRCGHYSAGI